MRRGPAALAAALVIAGAGLATAAGVDTRTRAVTIPSFDAGHATARCGAGEGLLAGGFKAQTTRSHGLIVSRLHPAGSRGSTAAATNTFVNDSTLQAEAYCGPPRQTQTVRVSKTIKGAGAQRSSGSAKARCPTGTTLRLGGFQAEVSPQPNGPTVVVNTLRRAPGQALRVGAANTGPKAGALTALAVCGAGPALRARTKHAALPAAGGRSSVTAHCERGEQLGFGGFHVPRADRSGPYVSQLRRTAKGDWRAGAFQFPRKGGGLTAIAYCG
jgi:hypothetical protein